MQPTLQTIADAAGVSRMTVSRALRNDPSIPERTRARIRAEAERQGYRPDPLVSALMTRLRTVKPHKDRPVIAYLDMIAPGSEMRVYNYLEQLREGARKRAQALGYDMQVFNPAEMRVTEQRLERILRSRGIRGMVISPLMENGPFTLDLRSFAAAALGPSITAPRLHRAQGHTLSIQTALDELVKLGLRRIGLALDLLQEERTEHALTGMLLFFQMKMRPADRIPPLLLPRITRNEFLEWAGAHEPEAVITFSHEVGWWLRFRGGTRPLVVNLNWVQGDASDYGIDQQLETVGAAGTDLVVEQLQSNHYGIPEHPKTVMLNGKWVKSGKQVPAANP